MIARLFFALALVLTGAGMGPVGVAYADQFHEQGVDRPGGDYRNFDVEKPGTNSFGSEVDSCRSTCNGDGQCKAWTLVNAGVQGPKARCWLKNVIPAKVANGCCTSGVPVKMVEPNVDRPGQDYRNFDLSAADPEQCRSACQAEGQCQAWTYVNPGVQGAGARCWLKTGVPDAHTSNCCTSGVADRLVVN